MAKEKCNNIQAWPSKLLFVDNVDHYEILFYPNFNIFVSCLISQSHKM